MRYSFADDEPEETQNKPQISQRGSPNSPARYELIEDESQAPSQPSQGGEDFDSPEYQSVINRNRNFVKSIASGATAGFSEYFDDLKVDYEQPGSSIGYLVGAFAPIGLTFKGIGLGFNILKNTFNFGSKAKFGLEVAHQALTGATYATEKELANVAKGEEFDPYAPVKEATEFAAFGALVHGLVKYKPAAQQWLKSLTSNQAEELAQGSLPKNLNPNQYKFWQDEVAPDWLKGSEKKYAEATVKANEQANAKFQQDNVIAKSKHQQELEEAAQSNTLSREKYDESVREYERNVQKAKEEHEAKVEDINKENQQAMEEFEEATASFEQLKLREASVENATRLRPGEEELPYRQAPNDIENPSLQNEAGNVISPNEIVNTTNAGKANIEAVRANDAVDYKAVNEAYSLSDTLSKDVTSIHTNLVQQLQTTANELRGIPHLSAPQQQHLRAIEDILSKLGTFNEVGQPTGFLETTNHLLHEQAKSLRYVMDFTFEHGNTKGIFGKTVRQLEEAAEFAARANGKTEAVEANVEARRLYREWSQDYNNDYIRPYRDTSNVDYSGIFKKAANSTDEFNALNNILSRSNSGQQLASVTRRAAVETRLGKFLENPHAANGRDFEIALRELGAVISPQEANAVRNVFHKGRAQPELIKKKPSVPKLKEIPEQKIPEFKKEEPVPKVIKKAEIAHRKFEETPEMKIAAKEMGKPTEDIRKLADTPSGLKKLKENTSKDVFKKIGQQRVQEILFEGKVKPQLSGKKLFETINKGDNYSMLSEILGETETAELLDAAEKLSDKVVTKENILKYAKKAAFVKTLVAFGIL